MSPEIKTKTTTKWYVVCPICNKDVAINYVSRHNKRYHSEAKENV